MEYDNAKVVGCVPVTGSSSWVLRTDGTDFDLRLFTRSERSGYEGHTRTGITLSGEAIVALFGVDVSTMGEVELVYGTGEKPTPKAKPAPHAPAARKAGRTRSAAAKKGAATRATNVAKRDLAKTASAQLAALHRTLKAAGIKVPA